MNRGILILLILVVALGGLALYAFNKGPSFLLKAPSEARIAYVSDGDIWTMKLDGTDKIRITGEGDDRGPAWSRDGREIASVSDSKGKYQLTLSAWNGSFSRVVTTSAGTKDAPVWGRDGEIIFLSSGSIYALEGSGHEERLVPAPDAPSVGVEAWYTSPHVYAALSPKKDYLLGVQETDFGRVAYLLGTEGGSLEIPADAAPVQIAKSANLDAAWAPTGGRIAIAADGGLSVYDVESLLTTELVSDGRAAKPSWSPDGKSIAFETGNGIYTVSASGGNPKFMAAGSEPCWSAGGKWIVYTAGGDIWRVRPDGGGAKRLTAGYSPACSL
ncbi:MAG: hypothetical protein ACYC2Y_01925 [Armatimonadota bacterium]